MPSRNNSALALLLLATAALAQGPVIATDPQTGGISGSVVNAVSGAPVPRAHVTFRTVNSSQQKSYGAVTDDSGKFAITGMSVGSFTPTVTRPGFVMPRNALGSVSVQNLKTGEKKEDYVIKIMPVGSISGRVLDSDGAPLESITVSAGNGLGSDWLQTTQTDDRGEFRIGGLAPGKYRVHAKPLNLPFPPEIRTDGTHEPHYGDTWYPGVLAAKEAGRVEVGPGTDVTGIEIHLIPTPMVRVSGKAAGFPSSAQRVTVQVRQGNNATTGGMVRKDGTFDVWRLDPGKYELRAASGSLASAPVEIDLGAANIDGLTLQYVQPFDLAVHVDFDDPEPPPPAPRNGQRPPPPRPKVLTVRDIVGGSMPPNTMPIAADGSFTVSQVTPSRYRLTPGWPQAYVKSVKVGDAQTEGSTLDLRRFQPGTAVTVVIGYRRASLSGKVAEDDAAAAGAVVALVPEDRDAGPSPRFAQIGPDGAYRMASVVPGKYKVAVVEEGDVGFIQQGAGLENYEEVAEAVELSPGDAAQKDLHRKR